MKKGLSLFLTVILLAGVLPAATASAGKVNVEAPSSWADPENDRAVVVVLPAESEGADGTGKLVMQIIWSESAWDEWVYTLVLAPETASEDKTVYSYINGTASVFSYDDEGKKVSETASNESFFGTVTAEADEKGETVLRLESGNEALPNLTLRREAVPVPSPEELAANVIEPILELEEGTAGSDMKTAALVSRLITYAVGHRLYAVDLPTLAKNLKAALKDLELSEEEAGQFLDKKNRVADLMMTILGLGSDPDGEKTAQATALFEDAGVMEEIDDVLDSALSAPISVELMLTCLLTIENEIAE